MSNSNKVTTEKVKDNAIVSASANGIPLELAQFVPQTFSVFGKSQQGKISYYQPSYSVRNDCQVGQWKIGDEDLLGKSLEFAVIHTQLFYGFLGKSQNTNWLQVWFVPTPSETALPANTVCVTYLKTESLTAFAQCSQKVMAEIDPGLGIFKASFGQAKTTDLGKYYVINFEWRQRNPEEYQQLKAIADFLQTNPTFLDTNLPHSMVKLTEGGSDEEIARIEEHLQRLRDERKAKIQG